MKDFPPRDTTKPAEQQGLFNKFDVRRVDGSDAPGGKHYGCKYFVLDIDHDPAAGAALRAYAEAVKETHPMLSADLLDSPFFPQQGREQTDKLQELAELACMLADDAPMKIQTGLLLISAELGEMVDAAVLPQVGEAKPNNELIQVADRHLCAAYQAGSEGIEFDLLRAKREIEAAAPAGLGEAKASLRDIVFDGPDDPHAPIAREAVARLLFWAGPKHIPVPHGGIAARTYAEFSEEEANKPKSYWKNGAPLYAAPVAQALPVAAEKYLPQITLTGQQLKDALDWCAPERDTDPDQLESEVTIGHGDERHHSGKGLYLWWTDYPEEGSIPLFDTPDDAATGLQGEKA